jgi:hypothetical protein
MEKAFDPNDLVNRLKGKGLPEVEGLAEIVVTELFAWGTESCAMHENAIVKAVGVPFLAIVQPLVMEQINKIDGQEG